MEASIRALAADYRNSTNLAASFLSWPIRRGIFVSTIEDLAFGEAVLLCVHLPFKTLPTFASGRVVWRAEQGVGIGFDEGYEDLADLIEEFAGAQREKSCLAF